MGILYTVLGTVLALGLLITIHEYGHFWVARRCGVRVLRFSIGFGAPLIKWRDRADTEYVIAAIPLGGYVRMLDEREASVPAELLEQAFNRKTVGQRSAIVAAGPLANFLLAVLLFWCVGLLGTQQARPFVGEVLANSSAAAAGVQSGDEIIAVDGVPVRGWSDVHLRLMHRLADTGTVVLRIQVATGDQVDRLVAIERWLVGSVEPDSVAALGLVPWSPQIESVLSEIDPAGPAAAAGLRVGDKVLAVNQVPVYSWQALVQQIRAAPNQTLLLRIMRDGRTQDLSVWLGAKEDQGLQVGYFGAGVALPSWPAEQLQEIRYGPWEALVFAADKTWQISVLTLESLQKMLVGALSVKNLSGPITIAKVAGDSAASGLPTFLGFLAFLSISLGVLNLLPVPVLDGGHLLFYFMEWIAGRPVPEKVQNVAMQAGVILVVCLMLVALVNDFSRL